MTDRTASAAALTVGPTSSPGSPTEPAPGSFQAWLIEQLAATSLRIERAERMELRLRERAAFRARVCWESDRISAAEILGEELSRAPSAVVDALRQTPQGCDWLARRWSLLEHAALEAGSWTLDQRRLAFDLLGTPTEFRSDQASALADPVGLARREGQAVRAHRAQVEPTDALDRETAEADLADDPSPELFRLRSQEAALHRRLRWYVQQLRGDSPRTRSQPQPTESPRPPASPQPRTEAPAVATPRQESRIQKAESRREARIRKLERRRA